MEKVIKMINNVSGLLSGYENADNIKKAKVESIQSALGRKLPDEIKCLLVSESSELADEVSTLFMGYGPIDIESLVEMYANPGSQEACLFLCTLEDLGADLVLGGDESFELIQDLDNELEGGPNITDMKNILPILEESGCYIVVLFKDNGSSEIAIATEDYCLSSIAPSLLEYLENLQLGLDKGVFKYDYDEEYDEGEIEAPEIWRERLEALE